jgi:hypothetical protein
MLQAEKLMRKQILLLRFNNLATFLWQHTKCERPVKFFFTGLFGFPKFVYLY